MLNKFLKTDELNRVYDGIARGEYHLLFGAGASIGASGQDGRKIPNAHDLAIEVLNDFRVDTGGHKLDLKAAYEQVEDQICKDGRKRNQYFSFRFSKCKPTWQTILTEFRWNKIWSLNIDDLVESAYQIVPTPKQKIRTVDWTEYYSEPDRRIDELQVVHLHGYAPYIERNKTKLVFSILEYLQATSRQHAWHHIFGDEFLQRPFIVVGARLEDEFDLADVIRRGNSSVTYSGLPSMIVLKEIPEYQKINSKNGD